MSKTVKNAEKNPRPSGNLIPCNMQSWHAPREPQQPGSEISAFNHYLNIDLSPSKVYISSAIPVGTYEKASPGSQNHDLKLSCNSTYTRQVVKVVYFSLKGALHNISSLEIPFNKYSGESNYPNV